jgi:HEAT repeat protein
MGILGRKPNVASLARKGDVEGLAEATCYRELERTSPETVNDVGIPVRTDAILALGQHGADAGQEAVVAALRDPADRVRCAAIRVLYARKRAGVLVQALRWLPAGKGQSRAFAARAVLGLQESLSAAAVANALIHNEDEELLSDEDEPLIQILIGEERAEQADELIRLLVSSLADERTIVADRAGELLLRLAPASTDALVAELRTGPAAAEAAYVLSRMANPQTLDALVEGLGHSDPRARAESAAALAELQDPAAVKPLLSATHDTDHGVRAQAGLALDRLGTAAVIVGVAALLEPIVREAVRSAPAEPQPKAGSRPRPARRNTRSRKSNGGPPDVGDPPSNKKPRAA